MDDQNQEQAVQPEQPSQSPAPMQQEQPVVTKPVLIGLGGVVILGVILFFFFYKNVFLAGQQDNFSLTSSKPEPTHVIPPTAKPIPTITPRPTHTTLYAEDTVSFTVPSDWKDTSVPPLNMSYVSNTGANFSVTIAPNTPIMSARERMDGFLNVTSATEPYYEHVGVGNTYGLSYNDGPMYIYSVANDKYYWKIVFKCTDGCTSNEETERNQMLKSMIFR